MSRFPENHTIVLQLLNVTEKYFVDKSCNIELCNDVAVHAINVIYQVSFINSTKYIYFINIYAFIF